MPRKWSGSRFQLSIPMPSLLIYFLPGLSRTYCLCYLYIWYIRSDLSGPYLTWLAHRGTQHSTVPPQHTHRGAETATNKPSIAPSHNKHSHSSTHSSSDSQPHSGNNLRSHAFHAPSTSLFKTFDDPAIDVTPAVNNTNLYHPEHEKKAKGNTRNCSYWFSGSMDIIIRRGLASGYAFEDGSAALYGICGLYSMGGSVDTSWHAP